MKNFAPPSQSSMCLFVWSFKVGWLKSRSDNIWNITQHVLCVKSSLGRMWCWWCTACHTGGKHIDALLNCIVCDNYSNLDCHLKEHVSDHRGEKPHQNCVSIHMISQIRCPRWHEVAVATLFMFLATVLQHVRVEFDTPLKYPVTKNTFVRLAPSAVLNVVHQIGILRWHKATHAKFYMFLASMLWYVRLEFAPPFKYLITINEFVRLGPQCGAHCVSTRNI